MAVDDTMAEGTTADDSTSEGTRMSEAEWISAEAV